MRRTFALIGTLLMVLVGALPAFAAEGDPLAEAVLLPGWAGLALVGVALLLIILFAGLARRGTH